MDRGAWWATVHGVAKSPARLSDLTYFKSYSHKMLWWLAFKGNSFDENFQCNVRFLKLLFWQFININISTNTYCYMKQ